MREFLFCYGRIIYKSTIGATKIFNSDIKHIGEIAIWFKRYNCMFSTDHTIVQLQTIIRITTYGEITGGQINFRYNNSINNMLKLYQNSPLMY